MRSSCCLQLRDGVADGLGEGAQPCLRGPAFVVRVGVLLGGSGDGFGGGGRLALPGVDVDEQVGMSPRGGGEVAAERAVAGQRGGDPVLIAGIGRQAQVGCGGGQRVTGGVGVRAGRCHGIAGRVQRCGSPVQVGDGGRRAGVGVAQRLVGRPLRELFAQPCLGRGDPGQPGLGLGPLGLGLVEGALQVGQPGAPGLLPGDGPEVLGGRLGPAAVQGGQPEPAVQADDGGVVVTQVGDVRAHPDRAQDGGHAVGGQRRGLLVVGVDSGLQQVGETARARRWARARWEDRARCGQQDAVQVLGVQDPAVRGDPGVEQPGRFQRRFQPGPFCAGQWWPPRGVVPDVDDPPQRCTGPAEAGRIVPGVRDRRGRRDPCLEFGPTGGQVGDPGTQVRQPGPSHRLRPGEAAPDVLDALVEHGGCRFGAVQGEHPVRQPDFVRVRHRDGVGVGGEVRPGTDQAFPLGGDRHPGVGQRVGGGIPVGLQPGQPGQPFGQPGGRVGGVPGEPTDLVERGGAVVGDRGHRPPQGRRVGQGTGPGRSVGVGVGGRGLRGGPGGLRQRVLAVRRRGLGGRSGRRQPGAAAHVGVAGCGQAPVGGFGPLLRGLGLLTGPVQLAQFRCLGELLADRLQLVPAAAHLFQSVRRLPLRRLGGLGELADLAEPAAGVLVGGVRGAQLPGLAPGCHAGVAGIADAEPVDVVVGVLQRAQFVTLLLQVVEARGGVGEQAGIQRRECLRQCPGEQHRIGALGQLRLPKLDQQVDQSAVAVGAELEQPFVEQAPVVLGGAHDVAAVADRIHEPVAAERGAGGGDQRQVDADPPVGDEEPAVGDAPTRDRLHRDPGGEEELVTGFVDAAELDPRVAEAFGVAAAQEEVPLHPLVLVAVRLDPVRGELAVQQQGQGERQHLRLAGPVVPPPQQPAVAEPELLAVVMEKVEQSDPQRLPAFPSGPWQLTAAFGLDAGRQGRGAGGGRVGVHARAFGLETRGGA